MDYKFKNTKFVQGFNDIDSLRDAIRDNIHKKYGSIRKFVETDDFASLGLNPGTVRLILAKNGGRSFRILSKITQFLGMGKLEAKVIKQEIFILNNESNVVEHKERKL